MLTFNKIHVISNRPDCEIDNEAATPSNAELEQEAKRLAMLATVQQTGGFDAAECR